MKALLLSFACLATSANAAVMLVDFGVSTRTTPDWNNFTGVTNTSAILLNDTTGAPTSISLTLGGGDINQLNDAEAGMVLPAAPPSPFTATTVTYDGMFQTGSRTFTLSGVTPGLAYNITLYSYVNRDTTRATTFSIVGTTLTQTIEPARIGGSNSGRTATFTGLTADVDGKIVINVSSAASTNWILSAMQIESVPEPAAALLGGLGLLPLLRRRRSVL